MLRRPVEQEVEKKIICKLPPSHGGIHVLPCSVSTVGRREGKDIQNEYPLIIGPLL